MTDRRSPISICICSARAITSASTRSSARILTRSGATQRHAIRGVGAERRARQRGRPLQSVGRRRPCHAAARLFGRVGAVRPGIGAGTAYKYEIRGRDGRLFLKADPYGFAMQLRPDNCSRGGLARRSRLAATASGWRRAAAIDPRRRPFNAYEVHLGSWRRPWHAQQPPFMSWLEAVEQLIPYAKDMGYTHLELMGVAEHPLDASWGYQVVGYYAATSRYGSPRDFMHFVDCCHQAGLGVILDWVPAHFPRDDHGLAQFDGTALVRACGFAPRRAPRMGHQGVQLRPPRGAQFPGRQCAVLGGPISRRRPARRRGRLDAVSRLQPQAPANGCRTATAAARISRPSNFLRQMNNAVHHAFPGMLTIAEESTSFAGVTRPPEHGGLGFNFKWNMGWMNDTLRYAALDPVHRRYNHQLITFSLRLRLVGEFHLADLARRGGARQTLADRQDARRRLAEARELSPVARLHVRASRQEAAVHGLASSANGTSGASTNSSIGRSCRIAAHQALRDCVRELNRLYLARPAIARQRLRSGRIPLGGFAQCGRERLGVRSAAPPAQDAGAPITLRVQRDPGAARRLHAAALRIRETTARCSTPTPRGSAAPATTTRQRGAHGAESAHGNIHIADGRLAAARRDVLPRILSIARSIQAGSPRPLGATWSKARRQFRGVFEPCDARRSVPVRCGQRRRNRRATICRRAPATSGTACCRRAARALEPTTPICVHGPE